MNSPPTASRRSLPWIVAATVLCVIGMIMALPMASRAAGRSTTGPEATPLAVTLNTLTPLIPKQKGALALTGTVTNKTDQPITGINLNLRVSDSPIPDRSTLADIANQTTDPGWRSVYQGQVELTATLNPNASGKWALKLPMRNLALTNSGVYALQVDAAWTQDYSVAGLTRTFLPWFPTKGSVKPTRVVWLWPISDWPNRDAAGVLLSDRTPVELAPGGRLRKLLDVGLAAKTQPQWVIDPQLLETADIMSRGYQVLSPTGTTVPGIGGEEAGEWLNRARNGLRTSTVYAMAYANPDVTALTRGRLSQDVVLATTTATESLGALLRRPISVGLGWPPGTRTDQASLNVLQTAGVRTVILDSAAFPLPVGQEPTSFDSAAVIRTESGPLTAALTDRVLSNSFASGRSTQAEATAARQRFLAETGVMATNSPDRSSIVAVGPDVRWDPNPAVVSDLLSVMQTAPWVRQTPLNSLLAKTPPDSGRQLAAMTKAARRAQLSSEYMSRIRALQRRLGVFSSVIVDPGTLTEPFRSALLRAESGAWRSDREGGDQLVDRISAQLNAQIGSVRVLSSGTITFSSNTGKVPITIANDLPRPVQVGIRMSADPSVRLVSAPIEKINIPANRKVSTEVPAQVVGAGELPVAVQLTNPAGAAYGTPTQIVLRSTAYARAATWVVAIAFGVLVLLLVMNSIRRRRARRDARPTASVPPAGEDQDG